MPNPLRSWDGRGPAGTPVSLRYRGHGASRSPESPYRAPRKRTGRGFAGRLLP